MTDPLSSAAQIINAVDKLINSWGLGLTLLLSTLFFLWGLKFDWFESLPIFISVVGAIGAGAITFKVLELCWAFFVSIAQDMNFKYKQSKLTSEQYAILKMCLILHDNRYHTCSSAAVRALDDAIQRFLESNLGYMDGRTFRFNSDYWSWVNRRRRKVIAKEVPEEVTQRLHKRVEENVNPQAWMAM